jgi:Rhodopirellula transposase DDE domain
MAARCYCSSSSRNAETVFGWNRDAVARGLEEAERGEVIKLEVDTRGSRLVEVVSPDLAQHVDRLCGQDAQVDPKFQTVTVYTRMTGESLRIALAESLSIPVEKLPVPRTLRRLMNRRSFSLRKVRKTIPQKKIPQTDAIFDNVKAAHLRAQGDRSILRISIDCKARIKTGPFSRGGKTRNPKFFNAGDHDMGDTPVVTPCGILEVESGQLSLSMNVGTTTSTIRLTTASTIQWKDVGVRWSVIGTVQYSRRVKM